MKILGGKWTSVLGATIGVTFCVALVGGAWRWKHRHPRRDVTASVENRETVKSRGSIGRRNPAADEVTGICKALHPQEAWTLLEQWPDFREGYQFQKIRESYFFSTAAKEDQIELTQYRGPSQKMNIEASIISVRSAYKSLPIPLSLNQEYKEFLSVQALTELLKASPVFAAKWASFSKVVNIEEVYESTDKKSFRVLQNGLHIELSLAMPDFDKVLSCNDKNPCICREVHLAGGAR